MSPLSLYEAVGLYRNFTDFLLKVLIVIASFLAPLHAILLTLFFLVLSDLITGVCAALKRRQKITSRKLSRTVTKLAVYLITILLVKLVNDQVILSENIPLTSLVTSFIIVTELQSILENINKIARQNFLKVLIDKLSLVTKGRHIR